MVYEVYEMCRRGGNNQMHRRIKGSVSHDRDLGGWRDVFVFDGKEVLDMLACRYFGWQLDESTHVLLYRILAL